MKNHKAWLSMLPKRQFITEKIRGAGGVLETGEEKTRCLALFEQGLRKADMIFLAQAIMISMFLTALLLSVSYFPHILPIIIFAISLMTGLTIEFMCRGDKYE